MIAPAGFALCALDGSRSAAARGQPPEDNDAPLSRAPALHQASDVEGVPYELVASSMPGTCRDRSEPWAADARKAPAPEL